jgi:hypothetical protein
MELEFDKEIDALLRKARSDSAAGQAAPASAHLDADEMSAVAENALPEMTRQFYTAHLADCDTCRKTFSSVISMRAEAVPEAASSSVAIPVIADAPWWKKLLAGPNLAYVMGTLVLLFSGFLGYLVLQRNPATRNAEVSSVYEPEPRTGGPSASEEESQFASNTNAANANAMANSPQRSAANTMATSNTTTTTANVARSASTGGLTDSSVAAADKSSAANTDVTSSPSAGAAAPPPAKSLLLEGRNEKKTELSKEKDDQMLAQSPRSQAEALRLMRDAPPAKLAQSKIGTGPRQNTQDNARQMNNATQASAGRTVSGKYFELRQNVWYDSAYHGQGIKTVRRGTSDFLRLDSGLRGIANELGGTVVIVWKERAYRIQ